MKKILSVSLFSFLSSNAFAYESIYEKTSVGKIEVKSISERIALEASVQGSYFRDNNGLFMKLFRFISDHEVEMTIPVEAEMKPGKMRFFVGGEDMAKELVSRAGVEVRRMPKLMVASIGIRGSYTEGRFRKNEKMLLEWLAKSKKFERAGPAYAVYWHGPFIPGIFKRSEVHLPIKKKSKKAKPDPKSSKKQ